jgi:hypothetical protein
MEIDRVATFNMHEVENAQVTKTHGGGGITSRKPLFLNQIFFNCKSFATTLQLGF